METFKTISLEFASIRLVGIQRCCDDLGHQVFEVELAGRKALYGEWRPIFESDGNSFNIKIMSFGFRDPTTVDNPRVGARVEVSRREHKLTEKLLLALFASRDATLVVPFTLRKANFLGKLLFEEGWARIKT